MASRTWLLAGCLAFTGCAYLGPWKTPDGIDRWQDPSPPRLSMREKAEAYQQGIETRHTTPGGVVRYRLNDAWDEARFGWGGLADGSFFQGIYLASQALRFATTGELEAREQILLALRGMRVLAEVSGRRGLLARMVSPVEPPGDTGWRRSSTRPDQFWKSDASKDQYAGFVHGLGVAWAVISDPEIRSETSVLASAVADHLIENDLEIVDWNGRRTTHGDLRGRVFGLPVGVNALVSLVIARVAAEAPGGRRHVAFHARLVDAGYPEIARSAHLTSLRFCSRVNENMAYLALYPLLLLERDPGIRDALRNAARRLWQDVQGEGNAFFAFVQAALVADPLEEGQRGIREEARAEGLRSLREFPDRKIVWPVDLTRDGFEMPKAWLRCDGEPRAKHPVPLYLRPRHSSLWTSDPYRLVGRLGARGESEFAGIDYLLAYWIGRYHGLVAPEE
jgi:hypothetical protein